MHTDSITIANDTGAKMTLVLEPWGMELTLPVGARYRIDARSVTTPGKLETETRGDRVTVFGWSSSTLVILEGDRLVESLQLPVPPVPPSLSVREFVNQLFKDKRSS